MFMLVTDNTADLPLEYLQEHNVGVMSLSYILDGVVYGKDKELDCKKFYGLMRSGKMPTTSQIRRRSSLRRAFLRTRRFCILRFLPV